ncbi:hypothetical protein [Streptomyces sp. NPDC002758]
MAAKTDTAPTPTDARQALDAARAEKTEAEALAAALAEQIRNGDETVKPADLAAARDLAEFADLRITAAERKLNQAAEADRHARADLVAADVRTLADTDDPGEMVAAVRDVADAVKRLAALTTARGDRVQKLCVAVEAIDSELSEANPVARMQIMRTEYGVTAGANAHNATMVVAYRPERRAVTAVSVADMVAAAVALGLPEPLPHVMSRVSEAFQSDAGTGRVFAGISAVGDDWRHSREELAGMGADARRRAERLNVAPPAPQG